MKTSGQGPRDLFGKLLVQVPGASLTSVIEHIICHRGLEFETCSSQVPNGCFCFVLFFKLEYQQGKHLTSKWVPDSNLDVGLDVGCLMVTHSST